MFELKLSGNNDFPTLCEQFSACFPLKGMVMQLFPLLRFDLIVGYGSIPIIPTFSRDDIY